MNKVHNALAFAILLCEREFWTLKKIDINIDGIFHHFFFYHKSNEEILEEFKVEPVDEELRRYKSNWLRHVTRLDNNRMPKIMLNYRTNRRRRLGRSLKRLLEQADAGL